jgi:hypothetical protein
MGWSARGLREYLHPVVGQVINHDGVVSNTNPTYLEEQKTSSQKHQLQQKTREERQPRETMLCGSIGMQSCWKGGIYGHPLEHQTPSHSEGRKYKYFNKRSYAKEG